MANSFRRGGIFVGALTAEAGVGTLVEALDLFPGARIDVVGSGPEGIRLAQHPQIRLAGNLKGDELQACIEAAAYLVLPTLVYDPMPRPVVDAFANGTPVIASRVGSLADLIEPGRNGLLFEPGSARGRSPRGFGYSGRASWGAGCSLWPSSCSRCARPRRRPEAYR
jgi:glycosyltransferase involved in cell wall biosynthesis